MELLGVLNLTEFNHIPDNHGIAKLTDYRIAFFSKDYDSVNFYNPPFIPDSSNQYAR